MPALSIIVPCYNEAENILLILEKFSRVLKGLSAELILVNNGSTDESGEILRGELKNPLYCFARVVSIAKNIGYGHGIMTGLREAKGDVLAWTHADLQTDPADVIRAYQKFRELEKKDANILIKGRRLNRRLGERFFTFGMACLASFVLGEALYDINAQPKMFSKSFLLKMKNPPDDFSLDLYLMYLAKHFNYKTYTIPVHFGERIYGESKSAANFKSRCRTIMRTFKYTFALRSRMR